MKKVYITYAKRTPIGKIGGSLAHLRVDDMLAQVFKDFADSIPFDAALIDDILVGCANQAGEDNRNLGRMSALLAGLPYSVAATTINRLCGSSLDAVMGGYARIKSGLCQSILIGGAESMTRAPLVISKGASAFGRDSKMYDSTFGWRFPNKKMEQLFPLLGMGQTAEEVQALTGISREDQDKFALGSHQKALQAQSAGHFATEILPVNIALRKDSKIIQTDEGPRASTTLEKLAQLKTVFNKSGTVTAGNSSTMNDGAACLFLASEEFVKEHKLTPLVEVTAAAVAGLHPSTMGLGPVVATEKLLHNFSKKITDFDVIELNEAFAVQALACMDKLKIDPSKVNHNGGAIALGHPLGCSGARILVTLTHIMQRNKNLKQGLATMCIGVGQGIALSIKNCR